MQRIHSLIGLCSLQVGMLQAYIHDGVPTKGVIHRIVGQPVTALFYSKQENERKQTLRKAVQEHDYETFRKQFSDTDMFDTEIFNQIWHSVELLESIDDATGKKINFKKTYDALRSPGSEHVLLDAIIHRADATLEFLVTHGFEDDITIVTEENGKNCYDVAVSGMNEYATQLCMGPQYRKNPTHIDRNARVARGFVRTNCSGSKRDTLRCAASRRYFKTYITELNRYQEVEPALAIDLMKDSSSLCALEDFLELLKARGVLLDDLTDEHKNNLIQVAILSNHRDGLTSAARMMSVDTYKDHVNTENMTPGDIARCQLAVCEQHDLDPSRERDNRQQCTQARKMFELYNSIVSDAEKIKAIRELQRKERELEIKKQASQTETARKELEIAARKQDIILEAHRLIEERNKVIITQEKEFETFKAHQENMLLQEEQKIKQQEQLSKEVWNDDNNSQ